MASEQQQDPPTASTSRIGPAPVDQRAQNAESESTRSAPDARRLSHIPTRAATGSPGPESPQPLSYSDGIPPEDEQNRLLRGDASRAGSFPRLAPHHPEEIHIEIPPQAAVGQHSPPQGMPGFPRPSIYQANSQRRSELDWIIPVEPKREVTLIDLRCYSCLD